MTIPEFLRVLDEIRNQFDWLLMADTGRHTERRSTPRFHLQSLPKADPSIMLDPIRAALYARIGEVTETWAVAGVSLGLRRSDAVAVAAAASDRTWTGEEGERIPEARLQGLRRRLIEAVGLVGSAESALRSREGSELGFALSDRFLKMSRSALMNEDE